jgi:hypothetical protein
MPDTPSPDEIIAAFNARRERVWNILIPAHAQKAEVKPWGVRWLHPTKGWKTVGKRRFAIRGVL